MATTKIYATIDGQSFSTQGLYKSHAVLVGTLVSWIERNEYQQGALLKQALERFNNANHSDCGPELTHCGHKVEFASQSKDAKKYDKFRALVATMNSEDYVWKVASWHTGFELATNKAKSLGMGRNGGIAVVETTLEI